MQGEMYENYKAIFIKRIFNFGDKLLIAYINAGGEEADELLEFKGVAMHFLDEDLMRKISEKAIAIYSETSMEEKGYQIEESIDRDLAEIQKTNATVEEARSSMKSAQPEELLRMVKHFRNLSKGLDWQLLLDISTKFIKLPFDEKNANYLRTAWEMQVVALAHLRRLDDAKKQLEAYKVVKELNDPDPKNTLSPIGICVPRSARRRNPLLRQIKMCCPWPSTAPGRRYTVTAINSWMKLTREGRC